MGQQSDRHERLALIQNLVRDVNEQAERLARRSTMTFNEFTCECADKSCVEQVALTFEEYEAVRRIPTHFFVKPGHVYREVERVVEGDGDPHRYQVVEMHGDAGRLAIGLDSRSMADTWSRKVPAGE